ncbi:MAG: YceI family protein [Chitinophagaceae bacterium]|nr:YceI family protein [Chitinophagaceae bacterium]
MKKFSLVLFSILFTGLCFSQKNYTTKSGQIKFFSNTAIEDVEAINNQVFCSINTITGKVQFAVLIKGFSFENALMQKHFNEEEYLHSDKYPKANFVGQIKNFNPVIFQKNGTYSVTVLGNLTLHGVTKQITVTGTISFQEGKVTIKSKFNVKLVDYKITVPEGISNSIAVAVDCTLQ